jgi:hypothetical protein
VWYSVSRICQSSAHYVYCTISLVLYDQSSMFAQEWCGEHLSASSKVLLPLKYETALIFASAWLPTSRFGPETPSTFWHSPRFLAACCMEDGAVLATKKGVPNQICAYRLQIRREGLQTDWGANLQKEGKGCRQIGERISKPWSLGGRQSQPAFVV